MSQQPPVIGSIMGNGRRRSISCPSCNGLADGNKLLAPVALTCSSDGSLYVGDFNYIRRIFPSGNVTNILELRYERRPLADAELRPKGLSRQCPSPSARLRQPFSCPPHSRQWHMVTVSPWEGCGVLD